jgi:hypothetical protein
LRRENSRPNRSSNEIRRIDYAAVWRATKAEVISQADAAAHLQSTVEKTSKQGCAALVTEYLRKEGSKYEAIADRDARRR